MSNYDLTGKVVFKTCKLDGHAKELYAYLWKNFTCGTSEIFFEENESLTCAMFTGAPVRNGICDNDYRVEADETGIYLQGASKSGLARAFVTLLQEIRVSGGLKAEKSYVPCGIYQSKPLVKFRGVHFCVFPETKLDFIERFIRLAGMCKYSHIMLEFWGSYRYECFPALGWRDASYTREQIKPLVYQANALGMEVIPFFNHFGHSTQSRFLDAEHVVLSQHPEYAPLFEPMGWSWCVSNPETLKLQSAVREELMDLCGEGSYFHIGMDESYDFASCEVCKTRDGAKLFSDFVNATNRALKEYGRQTVMWGDHLLPYGKFGGKYAEAYGQITPNMEQFISDIDKDIMIADWQYDIKDETEIKTAAYLREHGFKDVAVCPWTDAENIACLAKEAAAKNYGFIQTSWNKTKPLLDGLMYAAMLMWEGGVGSYGGKWIRNMIYSASLLRKCSPPQFSDGKLWNGDYIG